MKAKRFLILLLLVGWGGAGVGGCRNVPALQVEDTPDWGDDDDWVRPAPRRPGVDLLLDRKSTRLNSSH